MTKFGEIPANSQFDIDNLQNLSNLQGLEDLQNIQSQITANRERTLEIEQRLSNVEGWQEIQNLKERVQALSDRLDEGIQQGSESQPDLSGINEQLASLDTRIQNLSEAKQNKLVSGMNIKTLNGMNLLGSGNITITSGSSESQPPQVTQDDIQDLRTSMNQGFAQETNSRHNSELAISNRISTIEGSISTLGNIASYNIMILSQAAYDNISVKDNNTLYFIIEA